MKTLFIFLLLSFIANTYANDVFFAPIGFKSKYSTEWNQLQSDIIKTKEKVIYIQWVGYGGELGRLEKFIQSIQQAKKQNKKIVFSLVGNAISSHAIAACYADEIVWNGKKLVFHPARYQNNTTNNKLINHVQQLLQECNKKGIISKDDIITSTTSKEVVVSK